MNLDNLIVMANRIGQFFAAQPDRAQALAGIAEHVKKFWTPAMRERLLAAAGTPEGAAMSDIVREALLAHEAMLRPG